MKRSENSPAVTIGPASLDDAEAVLALQKLAFESVARFYDDWTLPPLTQDIASLREEFGTSLVLKATVEAGRLVGSVRAKVDEVSGTAAIERLVVHPDFQDRGIGSALTQAIETACAGVTRFELFTGDRSEASLRLYRRLGYAITRTEAVSPTMSLTYLEKRAPR